MSERSALSSLPVVGAVAAGVAVLGAVAFLFLPTGGPTGACGAVGAEVVPLLQPADGAKLRGSWHLLVHPVKRKAEVTACLDGKALDLPDAGIFPNKPYGGRTWLGHLDLAGVAPGDHEVALRIEVPGERTIIARSEVTYPRAPHRVSLSVRDSSGEPVGARITVTDGRERVVVGWPMGASQLRQRDGKQYGVLAADGSAELYLPSGHYRFLAVRSLFDTMGVAEVELTGSTDVTLTVDPVVDTSGWTRADLHVHSARSQDSELPDSIRLRSLLAAGLDVAVITDHDAVGDLGAAYARLGGIGAWPLRLLPGVEVDVHGQGVGPDGKKRRDLAHFNAFPTSPGKLPRPKGPAPLLAAMEAHRARAHEHPHSGVEDVVLQLNHPRGIHFPGKDEPRHRAWALFHARGLDPDVPIGDGANAWLQETAEGGELRAVDFDAVEVLNRFSLVTWRAVRRDWFALLSAGHRIVGTGNSDSHALEGERAGMTLNLVGTPPPAAGAPLDAPAFVAALREGRVLATTGPLVEVTLVGPDGAEVAPGGTASGGRHTARVRVRAAGWVPVPELRLVVDGVVVHREALGRAEGDELDHTTEVDVTLERDGWVLAEAGWPEEGGLPAPTGDYALVAPQYAPVGFTNPVFVDVAGDDWTAAP